MEEIKYALMDPSKNITILVETKVPIDRQASVAKKLLLKEKQAEQVGFITSMSENEIFIRMAGGEFCGNAAICVSSYYAILNELKKHESEVSFYGNSEEIKTKVRVNVEKINDDTYKGFVYMPKPKKIETYKKLPVVSLDGISHIIIEEEIEKSHAEKYIKDWCVDLDTEALGLMFYKKIDDSNYELKPLVYVKGIDSLFWENACASGTFAFGIYKMMQDEKLSHIYIRQTSGDVMEVKKDDSNFCLIGQVKYLCERTINI